MPKYGIHHIVLNEAIDQLKASASRPAREAGELLEAQKFYANLGAIGPDLFFFAEDYDIIQAIATFLLVIEFVEDVEEKIEEITEPIEEIGEAIGDAVDKTLDALGLGVVAEIDDRIEHIEKLTEELKKMAIAAGLLQGVSPLETDTDANGTATSPFTRLAREWYENFLIPPAQVNYEEVDWYWFDMLHYRNTGDFVRNLIRNADNDRQKAYALAYLTHIATDVVGHPYVNQIVGGPFRLGVQRHVTAENFMDAHQYQDTYGQAVSQTLAADLRMGEDQNEELHDDIAELLQQTFEDTYRRLVHPQKLAEGGFLTTQQIKTAYNLLRRTLNLMGGQEDLKPQPPVDTADQDLADVISVINSFDPPPPPPNIAPAMDDFDFEGFFAGEISLADIAAALENAGQSFEDWFDTWMGYLGEAAQYSLETALQLLKLLRDLVKLAANTTGRPILVLLYGVELALYDLIKACKKILALNGFTYPDPEDIGDAVSRSLMFVFDPDLHFVYDPGAPLAKQHTRFPKLRAKGQSHLIAPLYEDECQNTLPAFHRPTVQDGILAPARPADFIRGLRFSEDNLRAYALANSPADTRALQARGRAIGNAVDFSAWLIEKANSRIDRDLERIVFTNWNLDGDRGYGAKSWTALLPHNWDNSVIGQLSIVQAADSGAFSTDGLIDANGVISWEHSIVGIQTECYPDDDASDYIFAKIKAKDETYDDRRDSSDLRMSNLVLSEYNIPERFSRFQTRDPDDWAGLLAPRLLVDGDSLRQNVYHVNGVGTPAYDAFYERYNLEYFFRAGPDDKLRVKLLYNFTDGRLPIVFAGKNRVMQGTGYESEMIALADGLQALLDKFWSHATIATQYGVNTLADLNDRMLHAPIDFTDPKIYKIENATTIAVIALLYDAFRMNKPLGLMGYSHGTQILFNGIVAFGFQGEAERSFLRDSVRVFFVGRMVDTTSVQFLQRMVNGFDQLANAGDPISDLLGNMPPDLSFLNTISNNQITVSLTDVSVRSALVDFVTNIDAEEHKLYRYAPRIKYDSPNHQGFF